MFKPSDPGQLREAKALADYMSVTAQALGGTCTGIIYLHHIYSYTHKYLYTLKYTILCLCR